MLLRLCGVQVNSNAAATERPDALVSRLRVDAGEVDARRRILPANESYPYRRFSREL
jgi:hypothetical protein